MRLMDSVSTIKKLLRKADEIIGGEAPAHRPLDSDIYIYIYVHILSSSAHLPFRGLINPTQLTKGEMTCLHQANPNSLFPPIFQLRTEQILAPSDTDASQKKPDPHTLPHPPLQGATLCLQTEGHHCS